MEPNPRMYVSPHWMPLFKKASDATGADCMDARLRQSYYKFMKRNYVNRHRSTVYGSWQTILSFSQGNVQADKSDLRMPLSLDTLNIVKNLKHNRVFIQRFETVF